MILTFNCVVLLRPFIYQMPSLENTLSVITDSFR